MRSELDTLPAPYYPFGDKASEMREAAPEPLLLLRGPEEEQQQIGVRGADACEGRLLLRRDHIEVDRGCRGADEA